MSGPVRGYTRSLSKEDSNDISFAAVCMGDGLDQLERDVALASEESEAHAAKLNKDLDGMVVLREIVTREVGKLTDDEFADAMTYLNYLVSESRSRKIRHGSFCTGSEFGRFAHMAMMKEFKVVEDLSEEHTCCFEIEPWKRYFILEHFDPVILAGDMAQLVSGEILNLKTGRVVAMGTLDECEGGFSCTCLSLLNINRSEFINALALAIGSTGKTAQCDSCTDQLAKARTK